MDIVLSRLLAWGPATMRRRVHTVRGRNERVHAEHRSAQRWIMDVHTIKIA